MAEQTTRAQLATTRRRNTFMQEDVELALAEACRLGIAVPTAHCVDGVLERGEALGYGHRDLALLYEVLEQLRPEDRTAP